LLQVNIFVYLLYFYLLDYTTVKRRVIFIFKAEAHKKIPKVFIVCVLENFAMDTSFKWAKIT